MTSRQACSRLKGARLLPTRTQAPTTRPRQVLGKSAAVFKSRAEQQETRLRSVPQVAEQAEVVPTDQINDVEAYALHIIRAELNLSDEEFEAYKKAQQASWNRVDIGSTRVSPKEPPHAASHHVCQSEDDEHAFDDDTVLDAPSTAQHDDAEAERRYHAAQMHSEAWRERVESSSCSVVNPGAICCTKIVEAQDPASQLAMITIQTIARGTWPKGAEGAPQGVYGTPDLAAVAASVLAQRAAEVAKHTARQRCRELTDADRAKRHKYLERILSTGRVISSGPCQISNYGHPSYRVVLEDLQDPKVQIKALFKPRVRGDFEGWHRVPIEHVAYKLNLLLGMDYVPPVGYRTGGVDVDFTHFQEGAFIYWSDHCRQLNRCAHDMWHVKKDALLSDTRILDVLLQNSDRHHGHFQLGEHWAEGVCGDDNVWQGYMRPILIDHAAGFRPGAHVSPKHENAYGTGPLRQVTARTYLRLRLLTADMVTRHLSRYLTSTETTQIMRRREALLRYLDSCMEEDGYSKVVIEQPLLPQTSPRPC